MVLATPQSRSSLVIPHDSKEKQPQSFFNVAVFCTFVLGMGILVGYSIFYIIFRDKCADIVVERDRHHNESYFKLEGKYDRALTAVKQCEESSESREKTKELEGRLTAQAALSDKHQDLLARHERTLEKISQLQLTSETSQTQITTLKEEIKTVQQSLELSTEQLNGAQKERDIIHRQLQQHVEETEEIIRARDHENIELREVLDSCDDKIKASEGRFAELKNLVQQNQYAQIIAQ